MIENICAKSPVQSNCHLEYWWLTYSPNCGGGVELLPSNTTTTRKGHRFYYLLSILLLQPTMQNKRSFSNTFVGGRKYLRENSSVIQLSIGVLAVDLFTELWWCCCTAPFFTSCPHYIFSQRPKTTEVFQISSQVGEPISITNTEYSNCHLHYWLLAHSRIVVV